MFESRKFRAANQAACSALELTAIQKCHCKSGLEEYKGSCHVCHARGVLSEHFPGKLPYAIRAYVIAGGTLTEDLASCLTESDMFILNDELRMGWKVPFHTE